MFIEVNQAVKSHRDKTEIREADAKKEIEAQKLLQEQNEHKKQEKLERVEEQKQIEKVLLQLLEEMVTIPEEELRKNAADHVNDLKCATKFPSSDESSKLLHETAKKLLDALSQEELPKSDNDTGSSANDEKKLSKLSKAIGSTQLYLKTYKEASEQKNKKEGEKLRLNEQLSKERQTFMQTRAENLRATRKNMEVERELQKKLQKEYDALSENLDQTVRNLQSLNVEKVDLEDVIKYLDVGLKVLVKIQIAWDNIVTFFDDIESIVKYSLVKHMDGFTNKAKRGNITGRVPKLILQDLMSACAVSYILCHTAELYHSVHQKHIMPIMDDTTLNIALSDEEAKIREVHF
uniref:Uncharacterized protein n=1 Tax=Panagrolaimus davidi TaxID=227884 RepID=A0A914R102_9BILA